MRSWTSPGGVKVRFAWQLPVAAASNEWPSSFEDAILANIPWFKKLGETNKQGTQKKPKGALGKRGWYRPPEPSGGAVEQLHDLMHSSFKKGDFAATLFEMLNAGEALECPAYIKDALAWLNAELQVSAGETP